MIWKKVISTCFLLSQNIKLQRSQTTNFRIGRNYNYFSSYSNTSIANSIQRRYLDAIDDDNYGAGNTLKSFFFYKKFDGYALDVNCHHGDSTVFLQKRYPQLEVVGIDKEKVNIHECTKRYASQQYNFHNIDFEAYTGLPYQSFQLVQVNKYENLMLSFMKAYEILQEGGLLIMKTSSFDDLHTIVTYLKKNQTKFNKKVLNMKITYHIIDKTVYILK